MVNLGFASAQLWAPGMRSGDTSPSHLHSYWRRSNSTSRRLDDFGQECVPKTYPYRNSLNCLYAHVHVHRPRSGRMTLGNSTMESLWQVGPSIENTVCSLRLHSLGSQKPDSGTRNPRSFESRRSQQRDPKPASTLVEAKKEASTVHRRTRRLRGLAVQARWFAESTR